MGKYQRLIAELTGEATTWEAAAGAGQTSPYTPDEDARLKGLRLMVGRTAATTLTGQVQVRLSCTTFKPNTIHVGAVGSGLQTAPAFPAPIYDFEVDQPVKAGVPITIESRCLVANDVTNDIMVFGFFES